MLLLNLVGVAVYGLVLLVCLFAARAARTSVERAGDAPHWLASAGVFAFLAGFRLVQGEERFRSFARDAITAVGAYAQRDAIQTPLVIGAFAAAAAIVWLFARRWYKTRPGSRVRPILVSRFALLALIPLYALRLISLHQSDRFLYAGPIRPNWVLEGGICLAVAGAAVVYVLRTRRRLSLAARQRDKRSSAG